MSNANAVSSRNKRQSIYYTPPALARAMVQKLRGQRFLSILEPSCGNGAFCQAAREIFPDAKLTGIDIDADTIQALQNKNGAKDSAQFLLADFFTYPNEQTYALILGNPPYIRYQNLTPVQQQELRALFRSQGLPDSRYYNSWCFFLVKSILLLKEQGVLAFVLPLELLQTQAAQAIRNFLLQELDRLILIRFKEPLFPAIQQETLVLYGRRGKGACQISMQTTENIQTFQQMDWQRLTYTKAFPSSMPWKWHFLPAEERKLLSILKQDERFLPFSHYGTLEVGLTTGCNAYFGIPAATMEQYNLKAIALPLLAKLTDAKGLSFSYPDLQQLMMQGKRCALLSFPAAPYDAYPAEWKAYVREGEQQGVPFRYKCQKRKPWYHLPSSKVPDAFFSRRSGAYPKFVQNACRAVHTDTILGFFLKPHIRLSDAILSYYNSVTFALAELYGRKFGGGVLELLPKEAQNVLLPDFAQLPETLKARALQETDAALRRGVPIETILRQNDQNLLTKGLHVPVSWCDACHTLWKRLQQERLHRNM